jgi:hypothetical protein
MVEQMAPTTAPRRVPRFRWLIALLGILLVPATCTAWVFLSPEDPARYVDTLDALPVPPSWQVMRSDTQRDPFLGTWALRSYFVESDPVDAVAGLKDALRAAGFQIHVNVAAPNWCDRGPFDSVVDGCPTKVIEECRPNGSGGPIRCTVEGYRRIDADPQRLEHLYATLSPRGTTLDYGPGASPRYVSDPSRALVTITASLTSPRHFWASPTPSPRAARATVSYRSGSLRSLIVTPTAAAVTQATASRPCTPSACPSRIAPTIAAATGSSATRMP